MSSSSRRVWVSRCRRPTGWAGEPGRVTSTTSAASFASSSERSTSARRAAEQRPRSRRAPGWPPCRPCRAPRAAARRRRAAAAAARPCARGTRCAARSSSSEEPARRDRIRGRVLDLLDAVDHRETSYIATVAAMAAFSDSDGDRDVAHLVALREHGVGQSFALRADHERDLALAQLGQRPARAGVQRDAPPGQLVDPAHAHHRHREDRPHRGPHRLVPVGIGAPRPERDARGAERVRRAQHGPDVARVAHAPQRDAQRPGGLAGPALRVDGQRPRARARAARRSPAAAAPTSSPSSPEPAATSRIDAAQPAASAAAIRSSPSATNSPILSRHLRPASLRTWVRLSLWGLVITGEKNGRRSVWRGARGSGVFGGQADDASRALSAKRRKVSASRTAMSASILRSTSMPASLRPCMKVE